MKEFYTRDYSVEFSTREKDNLGIVEGHPIVLNSMTDLGYFNEIIESNALDKTNLQDVRFCLNHDTSFVYARSRRNNPNSTMYLEVKDDGLHFRANLDIENSAKARDLYSAIKRGDIDKMSFMFSIDGEEWEDLESDHPTRHITNIGKVLEVSAVTFPAYSDTDISARNLEALENAKKAMEIVRSKGNSLESEEKEEERTKFFPPREEEKNSSENTEQTSDARASEISKAEQRAKDEIEIFKLRYRYGGKIS